MNLIQILMTPSEAMNIILLCIFGFLEAFLYEKFFTGLLFFKPSRQQSIIYILSASIIAILTNAFLREPF